MHDWYSLSHVSLIFRGSCYDVDSGRNLGHIETYIGLLILDESSGTFGS